MNAFTAYALYVFKKIKEKKENGEEEDYWSSEDYLKKKTKNSEEYLKRMITKIKGKLER